MSELKAMASVVAKALVPEVEAATFDPVGDWRHAGAIIAALEKQRVFLMVNSATKDGRVRRIAALHRDTGTGYPCVGSSEWGFYPTLGEAVLRAAHEAVTKPRA